MTRLSPIAAAVLPSFVLALVAASQIGLALGGGLLAWKGGGFGMFATADRVGTRAVVIELGEGKEKQEVPVPDELAEQVHDVLVLPNLNRLEALADGMRQLQPELDATPLFLEVWRADFETRDGFLRPRAERIVRARFD
jgi:hypothetical protein